MGGRTRLIARALGITLVAALIGGVASPATAAVKVVKVAGGLEGPAAFTFTPKGTIVYLERASGKVRFRNPRTGFDRVFFNIKGVSGAGERGALGVALHPRWPTEAVRVRLRDPIGQREAPQPDRAHQGASRPRRRAPDAGVDARPTPTARITTEGASRSAPIASSTRSSVTDTRPRNAQDLTKNLRGKILRINPDGSVPGSNPRLGGRRSHVFAFGIRNSFGFAFDPETGRLWETENGPGCNDEINRIRRGGNYAWGPSESCPNTNRDGPAPRRLPLGQLREPDRHHRSGVLRRMRSRRTRGRPALRRVLRRREASPRRRSMARARTSWADRSRCSPLPADAILSMEAAPNGRIYFSDFTAIYRLRQA